MNTSTNTETAEANAKEKQKIEYFLPSLKNSNSLALAAIPVSKFYEALESRGWKKEAGSGIDRALLQDTNVPILFYDQTLLYQDDLEDCGEISHDAKLRVMPSCWFVLSREFLRVDGALLRIRDTRLFHRFGEDCIHVELTWRELSLISTVSPSATTSTHEDRMSADSASIPQSLMRNAAALAERLPIVNDRDGIHRFWSIKL